MDRARRDRPYRRPDDAVAHPRRRQGRDRPEPQARPAQPRYLRRLARIIGRRDRRARTRRCHLSSSIVCPTTCSIEPDSRCRQAVHPRCSAAVERRLFGCRRASGNALESVPQLGVAARLLVRREVALEHAAIGTEGLDAGFYILAPCGGKFFGRRRNVAFVEVETKRGTADTSELDVDVWAFGQLGNVLAPAGEDLLPAPTIRADAEHAADMIEDDRGVGKRAGEVDRVRQLRVILPGFEAEAEGGELSK